jgi:cyclophilin family peptidyl-prolyl cis-trans isomerase
MKSNACNVGRTTTNRLEHHHGGFATFAAFSLLLVAFSACNHAAEQPEAAKSEKAASSRASAASTPVAKSIDLEKPVVQIETSAGSITARLDSEHAPGTVKNFLNYVGEGFYDNTLIHYVDPNKMIVAGGYSADRQPKFGRTPIRNEAHNGKKNVRGTIAMARDASLIDGATTHFFINLADAPQRDHTGDTPDNYGYCVFGEVTEGLDVAEKISQAPTTDAGGDLAQTPEPAITIKSIRVVR